MNSELRSRWRIVKRCLPPFSRSVKEPEATHGNAGSACTAGDGCAVRNGETVPATVSSGRTCSAGVLGTRYPHRSTGHASALGFGYTPAPSGFTRFHQRFRKAHRRHRRKGRCMDRTQAPQRTESIHTDFLGWLDRQQGRQYDLHRRHVNPVFVKMLKTIGFDKGYVRGEGCYLWDAEGNKYLDLLTGWGVFALGRNHPKVRAILQQLIGRDIPNLVRMECSLLAGLAAEMLTKHASNPGGDLS